MPGMKATTQKTRVLVVGGGFAGTKATLELAKNKNCEVTLLSDHSHFRYYPTLYHAATGGNRAGSRIRLSNILTGLPVTFVRGEAVKLNRKQKYVQTSDGKKLYFDTLLLALGNITNYFGIKGLAEHSFGIKSTEQAEEFKQHLHKQFVANGCPDLNYVIVGGGPTGIELAGALPDYLRDVMKRHGVSDCKLTITLIDSSPRLLPRSPIQVSRAITKRLRKLGITIMVNTAVKNQTDDTLMAGDTPLKSRTVVWTAGVTTNPFFKENNFNLTPRGKVVVDEYLQTEPDIFVMGDNADTTYSGQAQTALYDGEFVAKNITRQTESKLMRSYLPKQPVTVIPVGARWATVQWGTFVFSGRIGWILRSLADLIGFHDLQSWPKAGGQWVKTMEGDNLDCPNCTKIETSPQTSTV